MTDRILYCSPEAKQLPPGTYLGLFHGRDDPDADMDDFGYVGPMIGPITGYHVTYFYNIRIGFKEVADARKFFPDANDNWVFLQFENDLLVYEGKYYGDWTVFNHQP